MSNFSSQNEIKKTEQNIQNQSFDEKYNQLAVEVVAEKYIDGTSDQLKRLSGKDVGNEFALDVAVVDSTGAQVESFGEPIYPAGNGDKETINLVTAGTVYPAPSTAPAKKYVVVIYNNSSNDIYWSFVNANADGIPIPPDGKVIFNLGANQRVYLYANVDSQTAVVQYKLVE